MNNISNSVRLIGRLGMDPEIRSISNDRKMARFSMATNEVYKDTKGEKVTNTTWHNLVAWGSQAVLAEKYLHKGQEIAIEGKLNNRSYIDKEGVKKYVSEVVINEIRLLGSPTNETSPLASAESEN